jgi:aromatic-L-amino-acid decarboxylase
MRKDEAKNGGTRGHLALPPEEMKKLGYRVIDMIVAHIEGLPDKPVTRRASRSALDTLLMEPVPEEGIGMESILRTLDTVVFSTIMHLDHRRFFAFVPGPSNYIGVLADALASGFNAFSGTWLEASGSAEIERVTVEWLRQLLGFPPETRGLFVSGGSMANLTGLVVARRAVLGDRTGEGVLYCSDQTHSSVEKGFRILGFDPSTRLRKILSDDRCRLSLPHLKEAVLRDRDAGLIPFCVVANAGTTNSGAVDPVGQLADICRDEGMWLHVDGAYGAVSALTERGRTILGPLHLADSLSLDPHKWLFQPYEMGCILVRRGGLMRDTFRILPEYLRETEGPEEEINFCDLGVQLSRRFRALKLWMSVKYFGMGAFRRAVDHTLDLAEAAEAHLRGMKNWELVTGALLGVITFRYAPPGMPRDETDRLTGEIVRETIRRGYAMVSSTELADRKVLRMCTINPRATVDDVIDTLEHLNGIAVGFSG